MFFLFLAFLSSFTLRNFVNAIIVDDTSDLLVYSNDPAWETASASQPARIIQWPGNSRGSAYDGTWHESLYYLSTVRLNFTGTAISVYGIVADAWDDTLLGFSLDGGNETRYSHTAADQTTMPTNAEQFIYGVQVFNAENLSPTSHSLLLTGYHETALFGLDYMEYTPVDVVATTQSTVSGIQSSSSQATPGTTNTQVSGTSTFTNITSTVTVAPTTNSRSATSTSTAGVSTTDDLPTIPPSDPRIVYTSPQQWSSNTSCGMSSMVTTSSGASFSFNFTGSSIWVYTATEPQGATYAITIDGISLGLINTMGSTCQAGASYYIGSLNSSMHTLIVSNANTSSSGNLSRRIDFLGLRLTSSGNESAVGSVSQGGGPNKAMIIGGAIGGVFALVLVMVGVYWWVRRTRHARMKSLLAARTEPFSIPDEPYAIPFPEKQTLPETNHAPKDAGLPSHALYRTYTKPVLVAGPGSRSYESTGEKENNIGSHNMDLSATEEQLIPPAQSTSPPSSRARPMVAQYQNVQANDAGSVGSHRSFDIIPTDASQSHAHSTDEGDERRLLGGERLSSAPPYVEDVLARLDARNLSEADVDTVARRLAEVMRIHNAARGGPGLLRGPPPRELIDQLVEEHLASREENS